MRNLCCLIVQVANSVHWRTSDRCSPAGFAKFTRTGLSSLGLETTKQGGAFTEKYKKQLTTQRCVASRVTHGRAQCPPSLLARWAPSPVPSPPSPPPPISYAPTHQRPSKRLCPRRSPLVYTLL